MRNPLREEVANSVTHGLGLLLSIAGLCILVVKAARSGDPWATVGCSVFGATLVILYAASTCYHALGNTRARELLLKFDHAAIFLLIAGSYTPITLVNLRGPWGWSLFGAVWAMAFLGIAIRFLRGKGHTALSTIIYIAMGWMALFAAGPILELIPTGGIVLIAAGGLSYTVGVLFFSWEAIPYNHGIWHLFVLGGSGCHYAAVLLYVVPPSA